MTGSMAGGSERTLRNRRGTRIPRGTAYSVESVPLVGSDAGVAAAPAVSPPAVSTSLATLLTRHVLRDGEVIILILKPSLWTIVFNCIPAITTALIIMISAGLWWQNHAHIGVELGSTHAHCRSARRLGGHEAGPASCISLSDLRIVRIAGVFSPIIHDIPLRKVARTRLVCGLPQNASAGSDRLKSFLKAISGPGPSGRPSLTPKKSTIPSG